jgi:hypothetical protein
MSSLNPDNACRLLKALGATQENEYRSKGRIFSKNNKYLVVHDNKQKDMHPFCGVVANHVLSAESGLRPCSNRGY